MANQIPAGPINLPHEILEDKHTLARGMVVKLDHPVVGTLRNIGNPINLSETPVTYRKHPPMLGEHNEQVDQELE